MDTTTADLLATAAAKTAAHAGLADAMEYGTQVSFLRLNGTPRMVVDAESGERFVVTYDLNGAPSCRGYRVGGSAELMARAALRTFNAARGA